MSPSFIILLNAIIFALSGLAFIALPREMAQMVTGSIPGSPSAIVDMRATYGGIMLGFGLLLFWLNRTTEGKRHALLALILIFGGMALGRTTGMIFDGPTNTKMPVFLVYEIVFVLLSAHAFRRWH